jgi:hypothetical protein
MSKRIAPNVIYVAEVESGENGNAPIDAPAKRQESKKRFVFCGPALSTVVLVALVVFFYLTTSKIHSQVNDALNVSLFDELWGRN